MQKMTTLFVTHFEPAPNGKGRVFTHVSDEVRPENAWVFTDPTVKAYRKLDGTACAVIDGKLYARYMVKTRKGGKPPVIPEDGIPAQPDPDPITTQHPYWVPTEDKPHYKHHNEAFSKYPNFLPDGTYEFCGPIVNKNKENLAVNCFINHNAPPLIQELPNPLTFESIKSMVEDYSGEGFVIKNDSGQMCKIRRCDFKFDY